MTTLPPSTTSLSAANEGYAESSDRANPQSVQEESRQGRERFFAALAADLVQQIRPATALDVACGEGLLVEALVRLGVDAHGTDVSAHAIAQAPEQIRDRVSVHDLTLPFERRWDLVSCIGALDQVAPTDTQLVMDTLTAATDLVLFSAAPPESVVPDRVNIHPVADWAEWFAARGFFRRADADTSDLRPWAILFERRHLAAPSVVRLYETELASRCEAVSVKRKDVEEGHRLPSLAELTSVDRVLTLTDQVIGLQAELGEAEYRYDRYRHEVALRAAPTRPGPLSDNELVGMTRARLVAEIELRQALQRKLEEEVARADAAEARSAGAEARVRAVETSRTWKAARVLSLGSRVLRRGVRTTK